jgi:hypothetical protein
MSSLLKSVSAIWENNANLCAMIPFARVFSGRAPSTEEVKFPLCIIDSAGTSRRYRTTVRRGFYKSVTFRIWTNEAALADGELVDQLISDAYGEAAWVVDSNVSVIDTLDEGPARVRIIDKPPYRYWEVVKIVTLCVERLRGTSGQSGQSGQ